MWHDVAIYGDLWRWTFTNCARPIEVLMQHKGHAQLMKISLGVLSFQEIQSFTTWNYMATAKGYKCRFAGYKFWILWSPHDLEMWIRQPLKAPEPMCKECLSASYNQHLTLQSFGGNEKRESARNTGRRVLADPTRGKDSKGTMWKETMNPQDCKSGLNRGW